MKIIKLVLILMLLESLKIRASLFSGASFNPVNKVIHIKEVNSYVSSHS